MVKSVLERSRLIHLTVHRRNRRSPLRTFNKAILMSYQSTIAFVFVSLIAFMMGCNQQSSKSETEKNAKSNGDNHAESHEHGDDDKLVWVKKEIPIDQYRVTLGHHGDHFHYGGEIEPAVMITKDGQDIAGAKIQNCLILASDSKVVAEKKDLKFEPKTEQEPAHYAQGNLVIPKDRGKFQIQFTIKLPGETKEHVHAIDFDVAH